MLRHVSSNICYRAIALLALCGLAVAIAYHYEPINDSEQSNTDNHGNHQILSKYNGTENAEETTAEYTLLLAIATSILAGSTVFLWKSTRDSVKIAERSLLELEAPFLSVKIIDVGIEKVRGLPEHEFGVLRFSIANYGRTPAILREIVDDIRLISMEDGVPPVMNIDRRTRNSLPRGVISPPQLESQPFIRYLLSDLNEGLARAGPSPLMRNEVVFYGFVRYETIFDQAFRMGFCFFFDRFSDRWVLGGEGNYNYLKRETPLGNSVIS